MQAFDAMMGLSDLRPWDYPTGVSPSDLIERDGPNVDLAERWIRHHRRLISRRRARTDEE